MEHRFKTGDLKNRGGIIGAVLGTLLSFKSHKPGDKNVSKAGKTAIGAGTGYLLGRWVGRKIEK